MAINEPIESSAQTLSYDPMERLSVQQPVRRISYLQSAVADKVVLDIGAFDETAFQLKQNRGSWLHHELGLTAKRVVGIDSSRLLPEEGIVTSPNSKILRMDVSEIGQCEDLESIDVVVAGEIIEHIPDALGFLSSLRRVGFRRGTVLLVTTPNATALHNVLLAVAHRESGHKDHVAVYSYLTLRTLFSRAGFASCEVIPYKVHFIDARTSRRRVARVSFAVAEHFVNAAAWCFPMLAGGWIVRAEL